MGTSLMSACIVAAQMVMVPFAMLVGAKADRWGHKRFFLAALLILPSGRAYTLSDNPFWLVGVQLLDGVGAGIFGAIFPVIVADLMRNTGRFNVAQGAIITAQSIGAALSTTLAGLVVVGAGYSAAFITLGAVAAIGAAVCLLALPETRQIANGGRPTGKTAAGFGYRCRMNRTTSRMNVPSEAIWAWSIIVAATAGVIIRPFRLPEAIWAVIGAGALVLLGLLPWQDALTGIEKGVDVYLFLIGMMLIAELARLEGLFDYLAALAVEYAAGSPQRLFLLIYSSARSSPCCSPTTPPRSC